MTKIEKEDLVEKVLKQFDFDAMRAKMIREGEYWFDQETDGDYTPSTLEIINTAREMLMKAVQAKCMVEGQNLVAIYDGNQLALIYTPSMASVNV